MTYLQILNIIKDTALAQPNVNSVVREFLDLNREDAKYSAVVIQDRDGSRDRIVEQDYVTYTWHLGYVDRLTYDESNRDDIISTGINIINNIVNTIRNTWFPELEVSIVDRINTFDQRFTAQCAGVYVVLAVNAQVSDCVDGESTDLYDTYDAKITENGVYHFVPSGRPVDEINITVDVPGPKEEVILNEKIVTNGLHTYTPPEDTVYGSVEINVDVQQSVSGYTVRDILEVGLDMVNLYDSSTTMVRKYATADNNNLQTVSLPACSYVGGNAFRSCFSLQTVSLPACTYVSEYAFVECHSLQTVDLPACTYVGAYAFSACYPLRSISLPVCSYVSYEAFWNCYSLGSISLPVCEYIGEYVFENCKNLKYVYVGGEISDVCNLNNTNAFNGCSKLIYIVVPGSLVESYKTATNWAYYSDKIVSSIPESPYSLCSFSDGILTGDIPYIDTELYDKLNINNADIISVSLPLCTTVKTNTFDNCYNLQSVSLPACTSVGLSAFKSCTSLRSIYLPACEYIENDAFVDCSYLNIVDLPVCSYISSGAFAWGNKLNYVYVGSEISDVCTLTDTNGFIGCPLKYIIVPESLVESYKVADNWSYYSQYIVSSIPENPVKFIGGTLTGSATQIGSEIYNDLGITRNDIISVSLPNCVSVGSYTFQSCSNLQTVDLPVCSNVGYCAFDYCISIQSINIPNCKVIKFAGLGNLKVLQSISIPLCEFIGQYGLNNCYALTSISLPLCNYIGPQGLYGCSSLSVVYIGTGIDTVCLLDGINAIEGCPALTSIYVPASLVESYKTATNWTYYSDKIFGI